MTYRVALLQLATPEVAYLFRLNRIPLAKPIIDLLADKNILKVGAAVEGDLRSLRRLRHFREGGFVDLQNFASRWGIEEKSLRKLSAIVLGQRVSKAQRLSNWEAQSLTDKRGALCGDRCVGLRADLRAAVGNSFLNGGTGSVGRKTVEHKINLQSR